MTKQSEIAALRPRVGELYPALRYRTIGLAYGYIITLGNTPVIVRKGECVEVPAKKKEE